MNTQIEKKLYNEKCLAFHIFVHTLDFEKKKRFYKIQLIISIIDPNLKKLLEV